MTYQQTLLLFVDDTKLIKMLLSMMSYSEVSHLISWSEKWQLKFNAPKWTEKYQTLYDIEY